MFEMFKRLGKFIKYGIQGFVLIFWICGVLLEFSFFNLIVGGFFALVVIFVVEMFSRIIVWIVSGYFETCKKKKVKSESLESMQDYYRCRDLKAFISRVQSWHCRSI